MAITIHKGTHADTPSLVEFNAAMALETEGKKLDIDTLTAGVKALLDQPAHGFYLVAKRDRQAVGSLMITYEWSDWRNGLFWWIQSVYVHPDARRQGVYRQLYEQVAHMAAAEAGVIGYRLYVEKANTIARSVYEKLGMQLASYRLYETEIRLPR